jgi:hypothetical protein
VKRIALAFVVAPILASALGGFMLPVFAAILVPATLVFAVPVFLLFRRFGWLRWWHAAIAGCAGGLLFTLIFSASVSAGHVDAFAPSEGLGFCAVGLTEAITFWWIGLFRNDEVARAPVTIPWGMLVLIPLILAGYRLNESFHPVFAEGKILSVTGESAHARTTVRLSDERVVPAGFLPGMEGYVPSISVGDCWSLMYSWSTSARHWVYSLSSPKKDDSC